MGPFAQALEVFCADHRKRSGLRNFMFHVILRQGSIVRQGGVLSGNDRLFNFRARESFAGIGQTVQLKSLHVETAFFEMNAEYPGPDSGVG